VKVVAVTGAAGFIGEHLIGYLAARSDVRLRLLVHRQPPGLPEDRRRIGLIPGDLLKPETLEGFLVPGCTVINLAYLAASSEGPNLEAMANLAEACAAASVKRLVHCSTAVVAGRVPDDTITEETRCEPAEGYERTKFKMERLLEKRAEGRFDLAILRPTAVFGPGGKNLLKLADDLSQGSWGLLYLKSCLFGSRRMNLVPVDQVVGALAFLAFAGSPWHGRVFIVSNDDHPLNNYRDVEAHLRKALGLPGLPLPRVSLPSPVLALLLRAAGRSNSNPFRRYEGRRLCAAGFRPADTFEAALDGFAESYRRQGGGATARTS